MDVFNTWILHIALRKIHGRHNISFQTMYMVNVLLMVSIMSMIYSNTSTNNTGISEVTISDFFLL